jgi:hypothetical protein
MEYMFLIYAAPERMISQTPEQRRAAIDAHWSIMDDATARGVLKGCSPLAPPPTAVTVRWSEQGVTTTDGPYAETKELLGGYYLIDCENVDAARYWAERISRAGRGFTVEIRALAPIPARVTLQNA